MNSEAQRRIKAECREWLALLHSGDASDADRERFSVWLHADPQHERAYAKLQTVWHELGGLEHLADLEPVPPPAPSRSAAISQAAPGRAMPWAAAAAVAGFAILGLWSQLHTSAPPATTDVAFAREYATSLGEVRDVPLPDGSTLTLGAHSRAIVTLSDAERRVRLEQGEAYFAVAKDPARPFHVDAEKAAVRVIGTRFDVHLGEGYVRIAVAEGVVAVNDRRNPLNGGQRIDVLANGAMTAIVSVADGEVGAWRDGRLFYESASLADVVADLARYRGDEVVLNSPEAGALRVTAGLRVEQIDQFVARLPDILPVQVSRQNATTVIDARR